MSRIVATILAADQLNRDVYRVRLLLPTSDSDPVSFTAGQYLDLFMPSGKKASFSIASAPDSGRELELHIRHTPDSEFNNALVSHLLHESTIELMLGLGDCCLSSAPVDPNQPILFAAASTGFSQVKSMVEYLIGLGATNPIYVYWGARIEEDLYLRTLAMSWAEHHSNIHFIPVVSEPENSAGWTGRCGLLPDAICEDFADFSSFSVFGCGSPGMVYALLDALEAKGFDAAQMQSDVFAYAPRP